MKHLRKLSMQLASKMRFVSVQLEALLARDLWLRNARHANEMAQRLAEGARAVLIEDVSTTGHQVRAAAEVLRAAGVVIEEIILAIDRGGADHLREAGYRVDAVAVLRPTN